MVKPRMAMRAAMRTVLEGYQVMVLCPTTVLCYQHTQTFQQRMRKFPVLIEGVNRFISPKKIQNITEQFSSGKLDILIGTHKILGKTFQPKKLGLIIIDEEQRFGVSHKEKNQSTTGGSLCARSFRYTHTSNHAYVDAGTERYLPAHTSTRWPPGRKKRGDSMGWTRSFDKLCRVRSLAEDKSFLVHNRVRDIAEF